jgi:hypothetical protein
MIIYIIALVLPAVFFLGLLVIAAYGQENVTPMATPSITTSPQPNLQYLPQKAYIVPLGPNGEVAAVPYQDSTATAQTGEAAGIIGILTAVGTGLWAKFTASKENKQTNSALLNTKEVQKELARVMYNFQPEQSKALSDAPAIKLEALEKDKQEFAEKVAKS